MVNSIPASALVSVNPGVIAAGGTSLSLSGLVLTSGTRTPIGAAISFASAPSVAAYYGATSGEALFAQGYFAGFDGSNVKPAALLFAQYPTAAVAGYLRGGNVSALTLAQIQAFSGTITVSVDGAPRTSSAINLSAATSQSNAATIITTALGAGVVATYDSQAGAFVLTSSTTGANSSVSFATSGSGTITAGLLLRAGDGGVTSAGSAAAVPGPYMAALVGASAGFATFTYLGFEPNAAAKTAFAAWNATQNNDYAFAMWDTDITPTTTVPATASAGYIISQAAYGGTIPLYDPNANATATGVSLLAAFVMGYAASIDFTQTEGRTDAAFRTQSGLLPGVTSQQIGANLIANGYNFYGSYATASASFNSFQSGSVTGVFLWLDSYLNQIKLTADLQIALLTLLQNAKSVPYNPAGYALIQAACTDVINAGVNFGSIRANVALSASQIAAVNAAAGATIGTTLMQRGWYLQVRAASSQSRVARTTPPIVFFYCDGQSVQQLVMGAIEVQ